MKKLSILILVAGVALGCKEKKTEATSNPIQQEVPSSILVPETESKLEEPKNDPHISSENSDSGSSLTGDVSNLNINIRLEADQLFDFDKADLKPEAETQLEQVFNQINGKTNSTLKIIGYTDSKGSASYNKNLSLKRGEAVKKWLENRGLQNPIVTEGLGAQNPIAPNTNPDGSDNPEGRAKNRRVEIKTMTKQSL